jgi:hypothetical protein
MQAPVFICWTSDGTKLHENKDNGQTMPDHGSAAHYTKIWFHTPVSSPLKQSRILNFFNERKGAESVE